MWVISLSSTRAYSIAPRAGDLPRLCGGAARVPEGIIVRLPGCAGFLGLQPVWVPSTAITLRYIHNSLVRVSWLMMLLRASVKRIWQPLRHSIAHGSWRVLSSLNGQKQTMPLNISVVYTWKISTLLGRKLPVTPLTSSMTPISFSYPIPSLCMVLLHFSVSTFQEGLGVLLMVLRLAALPMTLFILRRLSTTWVFRPCRPL